jgi:hypothetical protein
MKRRLYLAALLLLTSLAFAEPRNGGRDKPRYSTSDVDSTALLVMSVGTIAGGLLLRYRRNH